MHNEAEYIYEKCRYYRDERCLGTKDQDYCTGDFCPNMKIEGSESVLLGVSPNEPIVTNENGGKQSDTPYGFHLLPIQAMFAAAQTAKYGADKYGETFVNRNYTKISAEEHINHCIQHLYAYLAGDKQDDHLGHAIVRAMFAYEVDHRNKLGRDSGGKEEK